MRTNEISQDGDGATPAAVQVPAVPNNAAGGNANAGATNQQKQQVVTYLQRSLIARHIILQLRRPLYRKALDPHIH